MSLDNNSANNFKDFLDAIKPYLNYQFYDMSGMGVEAFQFSTDEKPVGMWTDRKILYAKTVDCGALPNNNTKNIAHGISNLDKVYAINGVAINSSGNSVTLPNAIKATDECVALQADRTNVIIITGADWSLRNGYVTMLYTKTTDSPLASDEKYAGLTASGEVIYEKTVEFTGKGGDDYLDFGSGKNIVDYVGFIENTNDKLPIIGYWWNSSEYCYSYIDNSGYKIRLHTTFSNKTISVKIRYTKSS